QHAIDDEDVILAVERMGEAFLAVGGQVGHMPDLAECLRQIVGGVAVVFDDQETHDECAVSRISDVPRGGTILDCTNHSGTISQCPWRRPGRPLRARNARGGGLTRHPSTNSAPAGAAEAGAKLEWKGGGARAPPPRSEPPRGWRG